jgi:cation:H+ antiporter
VEALPLGLLAIVFAGAGAVTWGAGIVLTKATDAIDHRFNIGDALGGLILLGVAGSLPEIAVVYSAALHGHVPVIIGTLIGGISIQTLLLVLFDAASGRERPLSYLAGSVMLCLETLFAIVIAILGIAGTFVPSRVSVAGLSPFSIAILLAWVLGLLVINQARKVPRYNQTEEDAEPGRKHHERRKAKPHVFYAGKSTLHVILVFAGASAVTLVAGWLLEESGNAIATGLGIGSGLFAATFIALATSIPEISTGLESIVIGDNHLAISDIVGGNAFMLVLFLLGDAVARRPVLSDAGHQDLMFGLLGLAMMSVYAVSFIVRPKRCYCRLGVDSILALLLYIAGCVALARLK